MPVTWKDGYPYGECGQVTWYCPYDSTDPNCCRYKEIQEKREKMFFEKKFREALDKEYGRER